MLSQLSVLLDALRREGLQVRQIGVDSFIAQCPSPTHGSDGYDAHPSLSIRVVDDRVLLYCFAGCDPHVILASLGLNWQDVSPSVGCRLEDLAAAKGLPADFLRSLDWKEFNRNGIPAVAIPYYDADGIEVATRYRIALSGDRFRWRKGSKLVPYGLSSLPHYNRERPLWLVEGETDAATLLYVGEQVLGLPGKTTVNTLEPFAHVLRDFSEIVVWCEPDAENLGEQIVKVLGCPVKVVRAAKVGVKDVNELWLKYSGNPTVFRQQLETLMLQAEEISPPSVLKLTEAPPLAELLDNIANFVRKYVVLEPHQLDAVVLWVVHSWFISATNTTPYLWVTSPSKRCGKTRLAEVLFCLVNGARFLSSITPAAMFRLIATQPDSITLIIDEVDNIFTSKEKSADLTALLNAGFRRGLTVPRAERTGKGEFVVKEYPTFCPKVLIGLSRLPDTVTDRAIQIVLQRKKATDKVEGFDWDEAENEAAPLRDGLAAWAQNDEFVQSLRTARPQMPAVSSDRAKEAWRLLIAIADVAGGDWPQRARQAMLALERREEEGSNINLLMALKAIFDETGAERLTVTEIAEKLVEMDNPPVPDAFLTWQAVGDARRIGIWLSKALKPFGIAPVQFRVQGEKSRGYERRAFEEVWKRYCPDPETSPDEPSPTSIDGKSEEASHIENGTVGTTVQHQYLQDFSRTVSKNENGTVGTVGTVGTPETVATHQDSFDVEVRMECPRCGFWKRYPAGDLLLNTPLCPICGEKLEERPEPEPPTSPAGANAQPPAETSEKETPHPSTPSSDPETPSSPVPSTVCTVFAPQKRYTKNPINTGTVPFVPTVPSSNTTLPQNFSDPDQPQGQLFELVVEPDDEPANGTATEPDPATAVALADPIADMESPSCPACGTTLDPDPDGTAGCLGCGRGWKVINGQAKPLHPSDADPTPSAPSAEANSPESAEKTVPPAEEEEKEEKMVDTLAFLEAAFGPLVDVAPELPSYPSPPTDYLERPWETREERIQRLVKQLFKALRNFQRHYAHYHQACLNGDLCQICSDFVQKIRKFEQAKDTTELARLYSANKKWVKGGEL